MERSFIISYPYYLLFIYLQILMTNFPFIFVPVVTTSSRLKKVTDTEQYLSLLQKFGMEIFDTVGALPQDISIEKCYW